MAVSNYELVKAWEPNLTLFRSQKGLTRRNCSKHRLKAGFLEIIFRHCRGLTRPSLNT
jgi:hypothetical protein